MGLRFLSLFLLVAAVSAVKYHTCGDEGAGTIERFHLTGCRDDNAEECVLQYLRVMHFHLEYRIKERDIYNASLKLTILDSSGNPLFLYNHTDVGRIIDRISAVMSWVEPITTLVKPVLEWLNIDYKLHYPLRSGEVYVSKFNYLNLIQIPRNISPVTVRVEMKDNDTQKDVFCFDYKVAAPK